MIWCERIGESGKQKTTLPPFWTSRKRDQRNPSGAKISAAAFRLKLKKAKRRATSIVSIR
jgi:hypothetical protein